MSCLSFFFSRVSPRRSCPLPHPEKASERSHETADAHRAFAAELRNTTPRQILLGTIDANDRRRKRAKKRRFGTRDEGKSLPVLSSRKVEAKACGSRRADFVLPRKQVPISVEEKRSDEDALLPDSFVLSRPDADRVPRRATRRRTRSRRRPDRVQKGGRADGGHEDA